MKAILFLSQKPKVQELQEEHKEEAEVDTVEEMSSIPEVETTTEEISEVEEANSSMEAETMRTISTRRVAPKKLLEEIEEVRAHERSSKHVCQ